MNTVKVLVMDVDSTLIMEEGIDLLGEEAGVGAQVAAIPSDAMQGELDFEAALRERVALKRSCQRIFLLVLKDPLHSGSRGTGR